MPTKKDSYEKSLHKGLKLIALLLTAKRSLSLTELSDTLNCSKQTVLRLISDIQASGWGGIDETKIGIKNYYSMAKPKNRAPITLDANKLAQLSLCSDFLASILPQGFFNDVNDALMLMNLYLPETLPENETPRRAIGQALHKGHIDYTPFEGFLRTVTQAIYKEKACQVIYQKKINEEPQSFLYAPKGIMTYRESIYITGWRVEIKRIMEPVVERTLALQRFKDVQPTGSSTINIKEPKGLQDGSFGVMREVPFDLTVKFSADLATYVSERQWSSDQGIKLNKDGSLILKMTSRSQPETVSWLLGFGPAAKVLSPAWLVREVQARLDETRALYQKPAAEVKRHTSD